MARRVIGLRQQPPRWGPRKLRAYLEQHEAWERWPAASSIGDLLRREGLAQTWRKRVRTPRYPVYPERHKVSFVWHKAVLP